MKITILVDNNPSKESPMLQSEHGLSFYIECDKRRILCDTGLTGVFMKNAAAMGIDLNDTDCAFVSHGHNDHCGGLGTLLGSTACNKVFMHENIAREHYYSTRRGGKRDISCDHACLYGFKERISYLQGSAMLADGVFAIACITNNHPQPWGNSFLTVEREGVEQPDDFAHELALAFVTDEGTIILSPCSHNGAMNIIEQTMRFTSSSNIKAFIGGLHFVDGPMCSREAKEFADSMNTLFPHTQFHTGHCTCDAAKDILSREMRNIHLFETGTVIEL